MAFGFFDAPTVGDPSSYRALDLRRQIALAAMAQGRKGYPKTIGEGMTAIGDAIGERGQLNALNAQLAAYDQYVRDNPEPKASELLRQQDRPTTPPPRQQRSEADSSVFPDVAPGVTTASIPASTLADVASAAPPTDMAAAAPPPVQDASVTPSAQTNLSYPQTAANISPDTASDAPPLGIQQAGNLSPNPRNALAQQVLLQRQGVPPQNPMLAGSTPAAMPSTLDTDPALLGSPARSAENRPIVPDFARYAQAGTAAPQPRAPTVVSPPVVNMPSARDEPQQPPNAPHNPLELQGADLQQRGLRAGDRDMAERGKALMELGKQIRDKQDADAMEQYKLRYQTWQNRSNPINISEAQVKAQEADIANRFGGAAPYQQFLADTSKSYDATQQLSNTLPTLRQAKQALAQSYTGAGAEVKLDANKMLRMLGVPGDYTPAVATELLQSRMKAIAGGMIKSTVGSQNISDADRDFVEKAYSGKISMEPESLRRLLGIAEDTTIRSINRHNDRLIGVASDTEKDRPLRRQYLVPMQYGDDAVAYLKAHPETADLFDKKFGKGHAKAVLQGTPYGQ
jgi:hypothetical protein